ncbi:MAG TPA: hypothetical protein VJJ78_01665 [Candidatus Saccharimonadales bacterium]|nr:hypothetical protein [Candidatus Saccharimonadales bacterium]
MKQKLLVGLTGVIFISSFFITVLPKTAYADSVPINFTEKQVEGVTLDWYTKAKIHATFKLGNDKTESLIFFDRDIGDGTRNYQVQNYGDCDGEIDVNDSYTRGTVDLDFIPPNQAGGDCQNTDPGEFSKSIAGSKGTLNDLAYILSNATTIKQIDGDGPIFNKFDDRSNESGSLFLNNDDGDGCEDRIWLDTGTNHNGGEFKLYILTKGDKDLQDGLLDIPSDCRLMRPTDFQYANKIIEYIVSPSTTPIGSGKSWHPILTPGNKINEEQVTGAGGTFSTDGGENPELGFDCTFSINPLTWLFCPMIEGAKVIVDQLDNAITNTLTIDADRFLSDSTDEGRAFHNAWGDVRNISMALLVIAALVMVISQAISVGPFDAYTIRKVLPRMLSAVILISLSWPLLHLVVNFFNALGNGLRALIQAPFTEAGFETANIGGTGLTFGGVAVALIGGSLEILGMLTFVLTALVAVGVSFVTLVIRQMLVLLLAVLAPFAIACYILPNTESVWKRWRDLFLRALVVFPIISAFIAIGRVFATVSSNTTDGETGVLGGIIAFIAYFGPYFMFPMAFRMAGGAIGAVNGALNNAAAPAQKYLGGLRKLNRQKKMENIKANNLFHGGNENNFRGKLNRAAQSTTLMGKAGFRPDRWRENIRGASSTRDLHHFQEASEKDENFQVIKNNDDALEAALHGQGTDADARELLRSRNYDEDSTNRIVAQIRQAKRSMGDHAFRISAAVANGGTGTGYGGGIGEMLDTLQHAAGGDMALAANLLGAARSKAEGARRYDLSASPFGQTLVEMQNIARARTPQEHADALEATTANLTDRILETQGPGMMLAGRGQSVRNLIPAMQRRVTRQMDEVHAAAASGDQVRIRAAQRGMQQVLASTAGLLDVAGQVSPENAKMLADGLLSGTITDVNGQTATIGQVIELNRGNQEFVEMRREYGSQTAAQYNQAQSAAAAAARQPGGGPPNPGAMQGPFPGQQI